METNYAHLKFLQFKNVSYWDVSRLSFSQKDLSKKFPMVKLENILSPRKEKIKKDDYAGTEQIVSKISFNDGKIHLRDDKKTGMDLYRVFKNDLLVSNINFHQGAVAINDIGTLVCSTHYQPYIVDSSKIDLKYLILVLRSDIFLDYVIQQKTNGIKTEAHYSFIKELEIPLPPIEKQRELASKYEQLQTLVKQKLEDANEIEVSIDECILSDLKVVKENNIKKEKKLFKTIHYNHLKLWDVKLISYDQNLLNSVAYENHRLSDVLTINPKTILPDNVMISFVPMENVDERYGIIRKVEEKNSSNANGYTKFIDNDIIWAKITPCMQNGKSAIAKNLKNGYGCGSTEFHVIRNDKKPDLIKIEYIYNLLRMKKILLEAQKTFTGACGQQRVPVRFLSELKIPIPPIKIQDEIIKKIRDIKSEIESLLQECKNLKQQAISDFEQEVFN